MNSQQIRKAERLTTMFLRKRKRKEQRIASNKKKERRDKVRLASEAFLRTRDWQELRYKTLRRYGFKCMACYATGVELHVDHIKPRSKYPELALSAENLQVLCRDCNLGKGNKFEDDLRPNTLTSSNL